MLDFITEISLNLLSVPIEYSNVVLLNYNGANCRVWLLSPQFIFPWMYLPRDFFFIKFVRNLFHISEVFFVDKWVVMKKKNVWNIIWHMMCFVYFTRLVVVKRTSTFLRYLNWFLIIKKESVQESLYWYRFRWY